MNRIAIFASGTGSNAEKIIHYFNHHPSTRVALVISNKPGAGVLSIASATGIPTLVIEKDRFLNGDSYVPALQAQGITFIVLAGFLWKMPARLVEAWRGRIINIHPALLPKYGGKGMYGKHVHTAVIAAGEKESGISIHYVDEIYDHGEIILQVSCPVTSADTPELLAEKIHALEHANYPRVIEEVINNLQNRR